MTSNPNPCPVCGRPSYAAVRCTRCKVPEGFLTSAQIMDLANVSFRQLDYWCRSGVLPLSTPGSGRNRVFSHDEALRAMIVGQLVTRAHIQADFAGELARQTDLSRPLETYKSGPIEITVDIFLIRLSLDTFTHKEVESSS